MTFRYIFAATLIMIGLSYFLSRVFSGYLILPQAFNFGPIVIHYYGIIIALAVACAFYLAIKRSTKLGIDKKFAEDMVFWLIIGGFAGARIYHVLSSAGYYYNHPLDILKVWQGGLSIYGAVLGGIITILLYKRVFNFQFSILKILDWLTPSVLLGQIIGRFGNLFNYEAFGYPTNLPWRMFVPQAFRPPQYSSNAFFHPWFLYEIIGSSVILICLLFLFRFRNSKITSNNGNQTDFSSPPFAKASDFVKTSSDRSAGRVFFTYLLLYNVLRLLLEFLRIDSTFLGILRLNVLASLILAVLSLVALLRMYYVKIS